MRFRQQDFEPVRAYLTSVRSTIIVREWEREPVTGGLFFLPFMQKRRAARPARVATLKEITRLAHHADHVDQAGTVLREYFHIDSSVGDGLLSLVEAVEHVEASGSESEFLLAGYPDGGLISVSRARLPFQQGDPITWWGP